jgi:hypothetical protein
MRTQRSKLALVALPALLAVTAVTVSALVGSTRVTAATTAVPVNVVRPTVTGTAQEGQRLVGHPGQWSGTPPISYVGFWQRCDKDGGSCAAISGTYARNGYVLKGVDVGNRLRFRVQAKNAEGMQAMSSLPTAVIKGPPPPPVFDGCAQHTGLVPIAGISLPAQLTIDQALVEPSTITHGTRSFTARIHVSGCGGPVVGALVYATAIPFGQFSVPSEQPTGNDGYATLQFTALAGYPLNSKQQLLVMFARARKPGESVLGGISVRRLISFRVTLA